MKVLCLFLLSFGAAVSIHLGYKEGKRYSYKYVGSILHGVPEAFEKDLGLKIEAVTHLDKLPSDKFRMTLENLTIVEVRGKLLREDRVESSSPNVEEPLDKITNGLKKWLEKPIQFQMKAGKVETKMFVEKETPEYCVNMLRAIVNHLYLPIVDNKEKYQTRKNEITVLGTCDTYYTIVQRKPYVKVKRTIDLAHCSERSKVLATSLPNTDSFIMKRKARGTAEQLPNFVREAAYMHYDLQADKNNEFVIRKVVGENVEEMLLQGDQYAAGKAVAAHTKQELTLLESERTIPTDAKEIKNGENRQGLKFVFDFDLKTMASKKAQSNYLLAAKEHIVAITQQLKSGSLSSESATKFSMLVSMLRHCKHDTLKEVVQTIQAIQNDDARRICYDALARVGTVAAVQIIKDSVNNGIMTKYLQGIMFGIGWVRDLNSEYMKTVMDLCESRVVAADIGAVRTCWLSFGTLANRFMVKTRQNSKMNSAKDLSMVHLISKTLKERIKHGKDDDEKIMFLKAAGNAGYLTQDLFKTISDVVMSRSSSLPVKLTAVWALRHTTKAASDSVRKLLLPVLTNPLRDEELRLSSYKILMQNNPSILTCQMIAAVIARESTGLGPRSNQLVSYIISDLRTSVKHDKNNPTKASRARLLLRFVPRKTYFTMFSYSKAINLDAGDKMGLELRLNKIYTRHSFIPRFMNGKARLNLPGMSVDFLEYGIRMQGIQEALMSLVGQKESPVKQRNYKNGENKIIPRLETFSKMFGSEIFYNQIAVSDVAATIRDVFTGEKTINELGCTFSSKEIHCEKSMSQGHMLSEVRYMVSTLAGIPMKYSGKLATVVKGQLSAKISGLSQLLKSQYKEIKSSVSTSSNVSFHMHHKVGTWLPNFETGVLINHTLFSQSPNLRANLVLNKGSIKFEGPVSPETVTLLDQRANISGIMRQDSSLGDRQWSIPDLQPKLLGLIKVPKTCYGCARLNVMLCIQGEIIDPDYQRLKVLPSFPYKWLNNWSIVLKTPEKFEFSYKIVENDKDMYKGIGLIKITGRPHDKEMTVNFKPVCDKQNFTCQTKWSIENKRCPQTCKGSSYIDYSEENKLTIVNNYSNVEITTQVQLEEKKKTIRLVNTWNQLPQRLDQFIRQNRLDIITKLHRYFKITENSKSDNRSVIEVKLLNDFVADIFVDLPSLKLERINQQLPVPLSLDSVSLAEFEKDFLQYGICKVEGTKDFVTTDSAIIEADIPNECPFILAQDTRYDQPKWRIFLKKSEKGRHILIFEFGKERIEFDRDMTVKENGKIVDVREGNTVKLLAGSVTRKNNQLYFKSNTDFHCRYNGSSTVLSFSHWYHNRILGICGNNDGEQWTDFQTPRRIHMSEMMPREFIREWIGDVSSENGECRTRAQRLNQTVSRLDGKICFTSGRFYAALIIVCRLRSMFLRTLLIIVSLFLILSLKLSTKIK